MTEPARTGRVEEAFDLLRTGHFAAALPALRAMLLVDPRNAGILNALGLALLNLGRLDEAEQTLRNAAAKDPANEEPLVNLGLLHMRRAAFPAAAAAFESAIGINPASIPAHNNLGTLHVELARYDAALASFRTALGIDTSNPTSHANLGNVLKLMGRYREAAESFACALALNPRELEAVIGQGMVAYAAGDLDQAVNCFEQAIVLAPNSANAHMNLALALLCRGDFARGWPQLEWRWAIPQVAVWKRPFPQPPWTAQETSDGPVLVWAEQGIGDQIFYFAAMLGVAARGARIIFECDGRLVSIFRRSCPNLTVVARKTPPDPTCLAPEILFQAPLASLGQRQWPSFDSIARRSSVLMADSALRDAFRAKLVSIDSESRPLLVGVSWKSPKAKFAGSKSSDLLDWHPVLRVRNVKYIDLQYGETLQERAAVKSALGIEIVHVDEVNAMDDLDRLGALIAACDLVISVSNSTAHLSAALGVPTWILVPKGNGRLWYWFQKSGPSPWHENTTLFHLDEPGNWRPALHQVGAQLKSLSARRRRPFWKFWS